MPAECRKQQDGKPPAAKPEFKNAKVASLYDGWHRVVQLSAERRQRLQQMLDRLNEVSHCHHHHHFIYPVIQQYAHLHQYN